MDLQYKNKEGISLQQVVDILINNNYTKKELINILGAKKSIDTLLSKLLLFEMIKKTKDGRVVKYSNNNKIIIVKKNITTSTTEPINTDDLEYLRLEIEKQEGKPVTSILHKRNELKETKKKVDISKIYNKIDDIQLEEENPFRFVLNFFTSILNTEKSTPHFKRRDSYVVKSIFNKFKTLCIPLDNYNVEQQHIPFYRAFSIDLEHKIVKIYHLDMNRMVRGEHKVFTIPDDKIKYLTNIGEENV